MPSSPSPAEPPPVQGIHLSEVISALSYALDITEGQPEGHAVRSCLVGMRIAAEIGLSADERSSLFYALLLKDAGCSSNAAKTCMLFGSDDLEVKRSWKLADWPGRWASLVHTVRNAAPHGSALERAAQVLSIAGAGPVGTELIQTRCDRGADIARMLGFSEETAGAVRALDEHWDGRGGPAHLRGTQIPLLGRILCLAQTVEIFFSSFGQDEAYRMARRRSGRWFDPALVAALERIRRDEGFWAGLAAPDVQAQVAALEPEDRALLADDERLDHVAEAFAGVIDAKSPYTFRHSTGVAEAAVRIGTQMGFGPGELRDLRRAALLHDVGKLGVSNRILDKPGKLTEEELAQVRRHTDHTHRILERVAAFRDLALVAASHHERMDGSGYHRGVRAGDLPLAARILAVADVFDALSADRPYRAGLPRDQVLAIMRGQAGAGLCPDAFAALVACLGEPDAAVTPA